MNFDDELYMKRVEKVKLTKGQKRQNKEHFKNAISEERLLQMGAQSCEHERDESLKELRKACSGKGWTKQGTVRNWRKTVC